MASSARKVLTRVRDQGSGAPDRGLGTVGRPSIVEVHGPLGQGFRVYG